MDNKKYIEAHELPVDEKVYLKKDWLGWRVVEPPVTLTQKLLGSKRNRAIVAVVIILALMFYIGVNELVGQYKDIAKNPCNYCLTCSSGNLSAQFNLSNLNFTGGDKFGK